jgi:hypothetical protein
VWVGINPQILVNVSIENELHCWIFLLALYISWDRTDNCQCEILKCVTMLKLSRNGCRAACMTFIVGGNLYCDLSENVEHAILVSYY